MLPVYWILIVTLAHSTIIGALIPFRSGFCQINDGSGCHCVYKDSCYVFVNKPRNYKAASGYCGKMGGHLADIQDMNESLIVAELSIANQEDLYLDGSDKEKEGVWKWVTRNAVFTVDAWQTGLPKSNAQLNCLRVNGRSGGLWAHHNCKKRLKFVCEIRKRPRCDKVIGSSCYVVDKTEKTFEETNSHCKSLGGQIFDVENEVEQEYGESVMRDLKKSIWTDAVDTEKTDNFAWCTSRDQFTYSNWHPGEPNHFSDQDCMQLSYSLPKKGMWEDTQCDNYAASICELKGMCTEGLDNNCYVLIKLQETWQDAENWCHNTGGHLVDIQSQVENGMVHRSAKEIGCSMYMDGLGEKLWDYSIWRWHSLGAEMLYTRWRTGRPTDQGDNICASLVETNGFWKDIRCDTELCSMCEIRKRPPECDHMIGRDCYVEVAQPMDWVAAVTNCQNIGGRLVDIAHTEENDLVHTFAQKIGKDIYTDGTDRFRERQWRWFTTEMAFGYTNWESENRQDHGARDCMRVLHASSIGTWNDTNCAEEYPSMCKIPYFIPGCDRTYKDRCYILVKEFMSWHNASENCLAMGAHLADIEDEQENAILYDIGSKTETNLYIDGTDEEAEGVWKWVTRNEEISNANWIPEEPNGGDGENCIIMWSNRDGMWNDMDCNQIYSSVCEAIISSSEITTKMMI